IELEVENTLCGTDPPVPARSGRGWIDVLGKPGDRRVFADLAHDPLGRSGVVEEFLEREEPAAFVVCLEERTRRLAEDLQVHREQRLLDVARESPPPRRLLDRVQLIYEPAVARQVDYVAVYPPVRRLLGPERRDRTLRRCGVHVTDESFHHALC